MFKTMEAWEVDCLLGILADKVPFVRDWCFQSLHYLEQGKKGPDEIMAELIQMVNGEDETAEALTRFAEDL